MVKLIMKNNDKHPKKLCTFILSDEISAFQSSSLNISVINRPSNSSWIAEKLYDLTFNYVSYSFITSTLYSILLFK